MRLEGERRALGLVDELLQGDALGDGIACGGDREVAEHPLHGFGGAGGLVGGHRGGMVRVAEERSALGAERHDLGQDRTVVVGAATGSARSRRLHEPTSALAVRQHGERGMPGEEGEREQVLAVEAAIGGGARRRRELARAQSVELRRVVEDHGQLVGVGEQVLLEGGAEGGDQLIHLGEAALRVLVERGAREVISR